MKHLTAAWARTAVALDLVPRGDPFVGKMVWEARAQEGPLSEQHGTLAGYLKFDSTDRGVRLRMIEVNPGYRGQGVARFLIERLLDTYDRDEVETGQFTPEGAAMWNAVTGESVRPSTSAVTPPGRNWRTAGVKVTPRSPLPYPKYRVNERISIIEGSGYHPDADIAKAKVRQQEAYERWRKDNPRRPRKDSHKPENADQWVKGGYSYFTSANSEPGTVAFLDLEVSDSSVYIAYMAVRPDQRRKGHARRLIQEAYDRHPGKRVNWGQMMQPEIGTLYRAFQQSHPDQTGSGAVYY